MPIANVQTICYTVIVDKNRAQQCTPERRYKDE